ncbi:Uncharacterised protein [Mycobacteroides abscessus subsp. massiliense]|nr:Uncharacterised protein [Mycobacteroides abscessus subsp. massiliense]
MRPPQNVNRALYLTGHRRFGMYHIARQWVQFIVRTVCVDVLGHCQKYGRRPFGLGKLEGLAEHLRDGPGGRNAIRPPGDRTEHGHQVHVLMRFFVSPILSDLGGDRDQRRAVRRGVGDPQL